MKNYTCCICGKTFYGYGNNPYPLKEDGLCCDNCNEKVIEARLEKLKEKDYEKNAEILLNILINNLDKIGESETLSIIVMLLNAYLEKYDRNINDTIKLIKKGHKKYKDFLKESDN